MIVKATLHSDVMEALLVTVEQLAEGIPRIVREEQAKAGEQIVKRMQDRHASDAHDIQRYVNRTWNLTNSIGYEVQAPQEMGGMVLQPMRVAAAESYAFDVENGVPGHSRAYPFFWIELTGGPVIEGFGDVLQAAVDELLASVSERA